MNSSLKWRATELVVTESALVLVVTSIALVGNLMIFCALCRNARLRSISYAAYIASFTAADVLTSLFVAPLSAASIIKGQWIFGETVCQFQGFVCSVMVEVTVLTLTLAAADRCFVLLRPVKYSRIITRKITSVSVITAWLLAVIFPGAFILNNHKFVFHPGSVFCRPNLKNIDYRFAVAAEIVFIVFPLLIVAGCYIAIKRRMDINLSNFGKTKEPNSEKFTAWDREESSTRLFGAMTAGVLACWVPFLLVNIIADSTHHQYLIPRSIYFVCSLLALSSCAVKTFVYCVMSEEMKGEFGKIVKSKRSGRVTVLAQNAKETNQTDASNKRMKKYIRPKTATTTSENQNNFEEEVITFGDQAEATTSCENTCTFSETPANAPREILVYPYDDESPSEKENKIVPLESTINVTLDQRLSLSSYSPEKQVENSPPSMTPAVEVFQMEIHPVYTRKKTLPPIVQHRVTERIFNTLNPVASENTIDESFV